MNITCSKCSLSNPSGSRFCQGCGQMMGTTQIQNKTVPCQFVGQSPQLIRNATQMSSLATALGSVTCNSSAPIGQRELTMILTDRSGSMSAQFKQLNTKLEVAKRASVTLVVNKAMIDADDEIGVMEFNNNATILWHLSPLRTNRRSIIEAIQRMTSDGGTDIAKPLELADANFCWHRNNVVRRIIILTDGMGGYPLPIAESLKQRGVIIDAIGIGENPSGVNESLLKKMASTVDGELRYRFIKDEMSLIKYYTLLANKTQLGA
ncbi:MAG: VWA domain-containing protein [Planctomycetes bacterium]|nr:VWA domain-containing protein [Planctomycetota bacterium]